MRSNLTNQIGQIVNDIELMLLLKCHISEAYKATRLRVARFDPKRRHALVDGRAGSITGHASAAARSTCTGWSETGHAVCPQGMRRGEEADLHRKRGKGCGSRVIIDMFQ